MTGSAESLNSLPGHHILNDLRIVESLGLGAIQSFPALNSIDAISAAVPRTVALWSWLKLTIVIPLSLASRTKVTRSGLTYTSLPEGSVSFANFT